MPTFHVKAVTKENDPYDETVEAADRFAVYRDIRSRGDRLVSLKREGGGASFSLSFIENVLNGISADEKVLLARNLAAMLGAGLTTSRALAVMERQTKNPHLKTVLESLIADVRRGGTFSAALAKHQDVFPALMISMVRAGEESGKLGESLRVVATQMDRANTLKKKIRGALMYPGIVVSAMFGIGVLMLIFVVPTLTATFSELNAKFPPTTTAVIAVSNFLTSHTLVSLGLIVGGVIALVSFLRTRRGQTTVDFLMLRVPVIRGLVMEVASARTARTMSSLLSAGVDMILSIEIARDVVGNAFFQKVLTEAGAIVTKGGALSEAFAKHPDLYPPLMAEMIAVGEETGRLSDLLNETASFYEESVEQQTKDLSTIIEPLLMIVIGAGVGFFAIAMIAPIYSLSQSI